jgi:hypothetical protein
MGMFLSLSGVIGKSHTEVKNSLTKFAKSVGGGLLEETLSTDNYNCCIIDEYDNNTIIIYPNGYIEWDKSSEFISKDLKTTVFSCHIHDGDLWMYVLYNNGKVVDMFNPIPDYWDEDMSDKEIKSWAGSAKIVAQYLSNIKPKDIERYLVRWDLDEENSEKAYENDEFSKEDWQLLDFMRKIGLTYPIKDNGESKGITFKFWTKELRLQVVDSSNKTPNILQKLENNPKPWWKFW